MRDHFGLSFQSRTLSFDSTRQSHAGEPFNRGFSSERLNIAVQNLIDRWQLLSRLCLLSRSAGAHNQCGENQIDDLVHNSILYQLRLYALSKIRADGPDCPSPGANSKHVTVPGPRVLRAVRALCLI